MKKVLYGVLGLLSLLSLFIIACAFRPELADQASAWLYANRTREEAEGQIGDAAGDGQVNGEEAGDGQVNGEGADGQANGEGTDGQADEGKAGAVDGSAEPSKALQQEGGLTSDEVLGLNGDLAHTGQGKDGKEQEAFKETETKQPEAVAGRGGYVPVQGESEQVDDKEAEELREQYTYGETGEGLDFDPVYYPYYAMLDGKQQALYRQIYANTDAVNGIFNPVEEVSQEQLKNVFMAVFNDHPELFWLDTAYRGKFDRKGSCVEIVLQFNRLVDDLDKAKAKFQEEAEAILAEARKLETDYEVEVYIHNALLDKIDYDLRAPLNQSTYSGLVNGKTVCAGYARSFQYLMMQLGIPCYYCTGYAGEAHAWNIVELDGDYYNADATWDDTEPNTFDFFNKTDAEFGENHRREDLSVRLPACNGTRYANRESSPRQPGQGTSQSNARTLEEAGFLEENVLTNLQAYYDDCYRQIMEQGGSCTFQNVVEDSGLWMQCYDAYNSDDYSSGYMDRIFTDLGVTGCSVDIEAEPLRDGRFLLRHTVKFS